MSEKSVAEQVQEINQRWNPSPVDNSIERLVGTAPPEGDTRATAHVPMEELNAGFQPADDSVDAQRYRDDGDGDEDGDLSYDDMTKAELQAEIENRNAERDEDDHLSKSGNKSELIERLQADDDEDDDEDEG